MLSKHYFDSIIALYICNNLVHVAKQGLGVQVVIHEAHADEEAHISGATNGSKV